MHRQSEIRLRVEQRFFLLEYITGKNTPTQTCLFYVPNDVSVLHFRGSWLRNIAVAKNVSVLNQ